MFVILVKPSEDPREALEMCALVLICMISIRISSAVV